MHSFPTFSLLASRPWRDYELLDTGDGCKLERFGDHTFVRPEVQAMWGRGLPSSAWSGADATFQPTNEENGGHWTFKSKELDRWQMQYDLPGGSPLRFWAMTTSGRHLGVFPEAAPHWDFIASSITSHLKNTPTSLRGGGLGRRSRSGAETPLQRGNLPRRQQGDFAMTSDESGRDSVNILNLFGYTGLATLAAASAGARVTHVDASRKSVNWARENQSLSGLDEKPIRWIVDDALKFVEREGRRGARYDGLILDPPKFGRGPKGEVWEAYKSLPRLLKACSAILSEQPLFIILTVYAVKASAVHIAEALHSAIGDLKGSIELGELVTPEKSAGRLLSQAVFASWTAV